MKPFLLEVAEDMVSKHASLEEVTIIFPNRRAALYFRQYLTQCITKPSWSPDLLSIEEFFFQLSGINKLDRLELIYRLYHIHREMIGNDEPFDQFYFWGDMLLQDFDEVDKYLVDARHLFKDLSRLKELDESFDYLTDQQKEFLLRFWSGFTESKSFNKEQFLVLWRKLGALYDRFTSSLKKEGLGYEGMIQREVANTIRQGKLKYGAGAVAFVGFNALTKAEEKLIEHFVLKGASVYWDADAYFVQDEKQEAGQFFRQYRSHNVLGKTIPEKFEEQIRSSKQILETAVSQRIGQVKLLAQDLKSVSMESHLELGGNTVIVLPDESLLLSVLHSLPESLQSINVTMGFPLRNTPMFNLLDLMLDLQINRRGEYFSHRQATAILSHSYVQELVQNDARRMRDDIIHKNRVLIHQSEIAVSHSLLESIFKIIPSHEVAAYLLEVVQQLGAQLPEENRLGREYAFHFHRHLSRLQEVMAPSETPSKESFAERMKGFQKLFRQIVQSQKIPFVGEPLKGIQVMGVLETRNLDFENVFILSMNEGSLPASARQGSYIPHSVRKAYGLPSHDHHDAIYAYLFYRLLQRSAKIFLYYNSEPDVLGTSEMSRFLRQLQVESGLTIKKRVLNNPIQVKPVKPLAFKQSAKSTEILRRFLPGGEKALSPSALNDYIECRLRFYLKHIAGLYEAEEVEEELDARVFGNLLHNVMFWFYDDLRKVKQSGLVHSHDFEDQDVKLDKLIDRAFIHNYTLDASKPVEYDGQRIVVKEVVYDFAQAILKQDRSHAPFEIMALEEKVIYELEVSVDGTLQTIVIGGKIDRVDRKDGTIRIVDYKTGRDELNFESLESLFARDGKRSKAAFQTFFYSLIYKKQYNPAEHITPGLFNRLNLFQRDFTFGHKMGKERVLITDANPLLPQMEDQVSEVLCELFSLSNVYNQTENEKNCEYCTFKSLCRR